MRAFRSIACVFILVASVACEEDEEWRDTNRPDTFGDSCEVDAGTCGEPFQCVRDPSAQGDVCSATCATDDDCPAWEAVGHCAGHYQAPCEDGVCRTRRGCR